MTATNPITGDRLKSKSPSKEYGEGWDRIFGKGKTDEKKQEKQSKTKEVLK